METNPKNALMITGAAARISQEVACIDKLIKKKGLKITQDGTVLSGFSSGSLNLLALNLCFSNNPPLNWDKDYKEKVLWNLTNSKVYVKNPKFGPPIFLTTPLRQTLNDFLRSGHVSNYGDLKIESFVLTFSDRHLTTEWASNFGDKNQSNLIASDLFMASTAIPIVFPSQKIGDNGGKRNFPNGHFSDGGTGGQFKHFEDHIGAYALKNGPFESLNIVSPMREEGTAEIDQLKNGLHGQSIGDLSKEELGKLASTLSFDSFLKFLKAIQSWEAKNGPIAKETLISIPKMDKNFGILDFDKEEEQYQAVCAWIDANPNDFAVPLDEFVKRHSSEA